MPCCFRWGSALAPIRSPLDEVKPSSQLLKDYDKTLTKSEQKAAISDLEAAQAKARGESSAEPTGSTGAKSAEKQD